jgi:hypothetical protein
MVIYKEKTMHGLSMKESITLRFLARHDDRDKDKGVFAEWTVRDQWADMKLRDGSDLERVMTVLCALEDKGYIKLKWHSTDFLDTSFTLTDTGKTYVQPSFEAYYGTGLA